MEALDVSPIPRLGCYTQAHGGGRLEPMALGFIVLARPGAFRSLKSTSKPPNSISVVVGFIVGAVPFNPNGWGPPDATVTPTTTSTLPLNVPYAAFSHSEKLGRIADFTRNLNPGSGKGGGGGRKSSASDSVFDFTAYDSFPSAADNDSTFRLVDGKPPPRPKWRFNKRHRNVAMRKITPKAERRLERFKNRNFFKVTTTDDPVIRRLANEDNDTVFATDNILARLMCATRSVYSWDIVVQRVGNKLFFDKRDGSQLDLLSVHETSQEPSPEAKDDINSAYSLIVEAAYINQNFSQQVLFRDGNKVSFDETNPFANEWEEVASVAYRYRRWKLDDDTCLVARCEEQSVVEVNKQRSFLTLNALDEFDSKYSGVDWRQKLETQRDMMKLGYVSRVHPRDHFNQVILAAVGYKPRDFVSQINLNTSNMWGIVKSIVDLCMKLNEGTYVLLKDPSKPQVRIYEVPADAFENDYVKEPLPEEEQVQPPEENAENTEANGVTNDVEDK
ncbi:hypothetical protein SADUNF_Sadunf11G0032900 [Salix dunnii]|uniref:Eukaryotic translation initiation factor 3 subunit 7 n=1 Tax=Salix dunnii TaxID=1413687 RepID=A0A835JPT7_9ROSI|nr:hypothetical protein SADUNF_Sadunf11G0032900 [Salix dunnii]